MQLSDKGLAFIADFEGYRDRQKDGSCKAYQCQAGVWTCGYGATEGVGPDTHWTHEEALERFRGELVRHEAAVNKAIKVGITQDQYDALASFSYNCGTGAMQKVAAVLNKDGPKAAAAKLLEYCKFTDPKTKRLEVSRGLLRRRAAEARLMEPDDTPLGAMPQKVEPPPKKMTVKESLVKVGAPVVAAGEAIRQGVPSVPPALTDSVANAEKWKQTGTAVAKVGKEAWGIAASFPLFAVLGVMVIGLYFVFNRGGDDAKPE